VTLPNSEDGSWNECNMMLEDRSLDGNSGAHLRNCREKLETAMCSDESWSVLYQLVKAR